MPNNDQHHEEIVALIESGLKRLNAIEEDIRAIDSVRGSTDPVNIAVINALDSVNVEEQFELIQKARANLGVVRAKIDLERFSLQDVFEICAMLDEIKKLGLQILSASIAYRNRLKSDAELN